MQMEESNKPAWVLLIVALVFNLMLVSLPGGRSVGAGFGRSLLMDALTPVERAVDWAVFGVTSVWDNYFALLDTRRENGELRSELDRLRMEIQRNNEQLIEARRLRRMLALDTLDFDPIAARVTGGDPTILQRSVTLDKGSRAGLEAGATARTPDGIVGRVIAVSEFSSVVQLITDPVSAVGAVMQLSRIPGRVRGNGTNELIFEYSEDGAVIQPGQVVVTSGSEGFYPRGLPIGVITRLESVDDLVSTAIVEPAADLGRLEEVLLVQIPVPDDAQAETTLESRTQP